MCICVSVWAAESRRRERAPQTSTPAGDRAGGSVLHDPHRWDSSPWGFSLKSLHFRHISVVSSLLPLTDYLNNLSPDSKEYEDTQGTIKAWSILCKPPGSSRLCSWYKWRMYLLSGHRRYSQEGQFRFFSLLLTHQTVVAALPCLKEMMCNSWGKTSLFLGREQRLIWSFISGSTESRHVHVCLSH